MSTQRHALSLAVAATLALGLGACTQAAPGTDSSSSQAPSSPASTSAASSTPSTPTATSAADSDALYQALADQISQGATTATIPQSFGAVAGWQKGLIVCPASDPALITEPYTEALAKAGVDASAEGSTNWLALDNDGTITVVPVEVTRVNFCPVGATVEIAKDTTFVLNLDQGSQTITAAPVS